ncbi:MAG: hypothetical protein ACP5OR_05355 [Candidatus Dormibacteria bacterium]
MDSEHAFINISHAPCSLSGIPTVIEVGPDGGQALSAEIRFTPFSNYASTTSPVILSANGGQASFFMINPANINGSCWKKGDHQDRLVIGFNGTVGPFDVPGMYCGDVLPSVTPFYPGIAPIRTIQ